MDRRKMAVGMMTLALAAGVTACGNSGKINRMTQAVDGKNYEEAIELYNSVEWNEKELEKIKEQMKERMSAAVESYSGNACTYEEAASLLSAISKMNIDSLTADLSSAYSMVEAQKVSKENFETGVQMFEEENFSSAYSYFGNVIEDDAYYTEAGNYRTRCVETQCSMIKDTVNGYLADQSYEAALNYLGQEYYSAFSDDISDLINELTESVRVESVLEEAKEYTDAGDVASALTCITDSIDTYDLKDTDKLDTYYDTIAKDYVDMIMEKVDALSKDENYIAALNMLSNAQQVVDADEFQEAVEHIKAVKPTYLYDLKYSDSNRFEVVDSGDPLMDTIGNTYDVGNLFQLSSDGGSWSSDAGSVEYNLGYNYKTLTGVVAVDDISDQATGVLKIEGDGVTLLSLDLSRTTTPQNVALDVSNVNWLKISITDATGGVIYAILADFKFDTGNAGKPAETTASTENPAETAAEPQTPETAAPAESQ